VRGPTSLTGAQLNPTMPNIEVKRGKTVLGWTPLSTAQVIGKFRESGTILLAMIAKGQSVNLFCDVVEHLLKINISRFL